MSGELLGLCVRATVGGDAVHNCASAISDHWKELAAGRNLDRKRLLDETKPPQKFGKLPEKMNEETLAKVKAASVQIGDVGEKPHFSGVIIPDGYVITCAHHDRLPGAKLNVTLSDGRSAEAVVVGTNRLTDVCVLKLSDEGEWPFVNLGFSSVLEAEDPVVVIGYPITNGQKPMVLMSRLIAPTHTLKRRDPWSHQFYAACDDEQIARNLRGASGGGVFDSSGNVIGVLSSTAGKEIFCARVELFHKNWALLTASTTVSAVDPELLDGALPSLKKLMSELKVVDPKR
jgi:S1-C subfamily serine protease